MTTLRPYFLPAALLFTLGLMLYLMAAWLTTGVFAFPLDDSWIHQTYARTLAQHGQWAYRPGDPSSGSTSPLWTVLLAIGHLLRLPPTLWAYTLGILSGGAVIVLGGLLSLTLFNSPRLAGWTMIALAVEWHLLWAAVSGMEIPLYTALALLLMVMVLRRWGSPFLWGLVGGALVLTRPEGLGLVGLVGLALVLTPAPRRLPSAVFLTLGVALGVVPYLALNWLTEGTPFPNTLYAKQQEYAILLASKPLWSRIGDLVLQPFVGGQLLLGLTLPFLAWRRLTLTHFLPLLWAVALILLYALRLPVIYQHGRYLMPIIPVLIIYSMAGSAALLPRLPRLLRRPLIAAVITLFAVFIFLGMQAYRNDVAFIECEMGTSTTWLLANSTPTTLIATHDIGKLGYLTPNPLLDFAGLVSPETIPIIRDEDALLQLALRREASYLVTFDYWYPNMVQDVRLSPVFTTACPISRTSGLPPMMIYAITP